MADDKTLGITATLNIDEVLQGLQELIDKLNELPNDISTSVDVEGVEESAALTDELNSSLEETKGSAGDAAGGVKEAGDAAKEAGEKSKDAAEAVGGLGESFGILKELAMALVATGIGVFLWEAVESAGNYADQFVRLGDATGQAGVGAETLEAQWGPLVSSVANETGRMGSDVRESFIQMSVAGINSKDVLKASFDGIAEASFVTGRDISSLTTIFDRMVNSDSMNPKFLQRIGISLDDISKYAESQGMTVDDLKGKWKGMTVEQRASVLSAIYDMTYGKETLDDFKGSWEGLKVALQKAWDLLVRLTGQILLPILIPAIKLVTDGLKFLGDQAQKLMKGDFVNFFTVILGGLNYIMLFLGPIGWLIIGVADAVILGTIAWRKWGDEIIKFKDNILSGNWVEAAGQIMRAFDYIGLYIRNWFAGLPRWLGEHATEWIAIGAKIVDWMIMGLKSLTEKLIHHMTAGLSAGASVSAEGGKKAANNYITGFEKWLHDNWPQIKDILFRLTHELAPYLIQAIMLVAQEVSPYILQAAMFLGWQLILGLLRILASLPGILSGYLLSAVVDTVYSIAGSAGAAASNLGWSIVNSIRSTISNLPGEMYSWGMRMLNQFVNGIIDTIPGLRAALDTIRYLFPNSPPKEGPLSETTEKTWYDWASSLAAAGNKGLMEFGSSLGLVNYPITPNLPGNVLNTTQSITINHKHEIDLKNAPPNINTEQAASLAADMVLSADSVDKASYQAFLNHKRNMGV